MQNINIPLGADYETTLREYLLERFKNHHPNFGNICIITPSKETAKTLKNAFSTTPVIMPKITSIYELVNKAELSIIPDLKAKLLLFEIAKKYLQTFSANEIFYFLEDFLELDALITKNKTDLVKAIQSTEGVIENMSLNLKSSLITFLKIYNEWIALKSQNNFHTKADANILITDELCTKKFEEYDAVFLAYFQGGSKSQMEFISHIQSLNHGFVVLNFEETKGVISLATQIIYKLISSLNCNVSHINAVINKPKCFISEFENIPILVNQISLHAISILQSNPEAKIGFVCYNHNTGTLLARNFKALQIEVSTIFTESLNQNSFFILFLQYLNGEDLFCILSLIKSPFTIFAKDEAEKFEKDLKSPNLKAKHGFNIPKAELEVFDKFLQIEVEKFKSILTEDAKCDEGFEEFASFITKIQAEVEGFKGESIKVYIALLSNSAKAERVMEQNSNNIFILSSIEARGMNFDYLFLTDLLDGNLPSPPNSNKILSYHLQKLLKINEFKEEIEWLDFTTSIYSAKNIYASTTKTQFEEGKTYTKSPFLLHAMECFLFENFTETFYESSTVMLEKLNPAFDLKQIIHLTPTSFEKLLNNPFSFYAQYILKLQTQNSIPEDLEKLTIGNIIHKAIYEFYTRGKNIQNYCKKAFEDIGYPLEFIINEVALQGVQNFFESIKEKPNSVIMEQKIQSHIEVGGHLISLEGRPDRIEFYEDEIRIIDYKVYSSKISQNEVNSGSKPQLPFLGFIISNLYPEFKGKIKLFYYFIDLNDLSEPVQPVNMKFNDFNIVESSIKFLLLNLKTFIAKEEDYNVYQHLIRSYE